MTSRRTTEEVLRAQRDEAERKYEDCERDRRSLAHRVQRAEFQLDHYKAENERLRKQIECGTCRGYGIIEAPATSQGFTDCPDCPPERDERPLEGDATVEVPTSWPVSTNEGDSNE